MTVTVPLQLSVAVTLVLSAGATALEHDTVVSAGKVLITGAVSSSTVMVWLRLLLLPQESVA